jgi:16S rRNA (guanine(966)-N(2))-methyltransferase RsmD
MRIIGGKFKARRIAVPTSITARPTTDFAKEGLFNLLNNRIDFEEIDVLDLFSGTGSIVIELISRGAKTAVAVEESSHHTSFIRKAAEILKIDNLTVLKADALKFITSTRIQFDFIFADPPYDLKKIEEIPNLIFKNELLKSDGLFVLEHSVKNDFSLHPNFVFHRNYGNVHFSFFELEKNED